MRKFYFTAILAIANVLYINSQTTVSYVQQEGNYNANFTTGTAGDFNNGGTELGMFANGGGTKQVVSWRNFTDDGTTGGTPTTMDVGDTFQITLEAYQAFGEIGLSLLSSPSSTSSYADRNNNYALQVVLDGNSGSFDPWDITSTGGTVDATTINGSNSGDINVFVFTFTLKTSTTMEVTIERTNNTATSYTQTVTLNNTNITGYSVYLDDDWDGNSNENIYWTQTSQYVYATEWDGSEGTDWSTSGNWSAGVPSSTSNARIPDVANAPIIGSTTAAEVNDLSISEADGLTISSGGSLIVSGTSNGNVTYNRNLGTENWYLISSPVNGETYDILFVIANNLAINGSNNAIGSYTTGTDVWAYMQTGGGSTFNSGQGYTVRRATGQGAGDISFTGTINTGDISDVSVDVSGNAFNLLGNPYTSYMNSATFLTTNTAQLASQTLWVWNQGTSNYDTKVTVDAFILAPGQGFFVQATDNAPNNVDFAESNQTGYSGGTGDTFQRTSRPEIHLLMTDGTSDRFAKVYYIAGTTTGFDNGFDGEAFGGQSNAIDVYTHLVTDSDGRNFQVQSLPDSNFENMIVPVGVKSGAGTVTFSVDDFNLPAGYKVFLEDKDTGNFIRLDEDGSKYDVTFDNPVDGIGRFFLHMNTNALSTGSFDLTNISAYLSDSRNLRVVGIQSGTTQVRLFNILGKQVFNTSIQSNGVDDVTLPSLRQGVYIVQIVSSEGTINKKIIIE